VTFRTLPLFLLRVQQRLRRSIRAIRLGRSGSLPPACVRRALGKSPRRPRCGSEVRHVTEGRWQRGYLVDVWPTMWG